MNRTYADKVQGNSTDPNNPHVYNNPCLQVLKDNTSTAEMLPQPPPPLDWGFTVQWCEGGRQELWVELSQPNTT